MKFVLSGEGPTDIGKIDYYTRSFDPGPMAYFIDAIVRDKKGFSPLKSIPMMTMSFISSLSRI